MEVDFFCRKCGKKCVDYLDTAFREDVWLGLCHTCYLIEKHGGYWICSNCHTKVELGTLECPYCGHEEIIL